MSAVGIADSGPLEFVRRAYESLFILLLFIILVFVPFAYFYAEESGDDPYAASEGSSKCCTAIKYTAMFEVVRIALARRSPLPLMTVLNLPASVVGSPFWAGHVI